METVAQVPFRHWRLCFKNMQEWEEWIPRGAGQEIEGFPKLRMLSLVRCSELQGSLPEHLPLLEKLVIKSCEQLPVTIHCLPALSELQIDGCKKVVFSSPIDLSSLKSVLLRDIANQVKIQHLQDIRSLNRLQISGCPQLLSLATEEEHDQQQPELPCSLQFLELAYCQGLQKIPQALLTLSSLSEMRIWSCNSLVSFPQAALPSQLRTVEINDCNALESLPEAWMGNSDSSLQSLEIGGCNSLVSFPEAALPSQLRKIVIAECDALESLPDAWMGNSDSSLQSLEIRHCNSLVSFPEAALPSQLRTIVIEKCNALESFPEATMPSQLRAITLVGCNALKSLPEAWMQNSSTSLESLKIECCDSLTYIARIQLPPCVKQLIIERCPNLRTLTGEHHIRRSSSGSTSPTSISSEIELPGTLELLDVRDCSKLESLAERLDNTSLEKIIIYRLVNLKSLPAGLYNLHHLRMIHIPSCPNLDSFPEGGLPSTNLTDLTIWNCKNLKALPNGMHNLTSLLRLEIGGCHSLVSFPEDGFPTNLQSLCVYHLKISKPLFEWGLNRFTSLTELRITGGCPDLVSSPQFPASLAALSISDMPNLKRLSSIDQNLTSLEVLVLSKCPKLKYVSNQGLPKSLLRLDISGCPLIEKRCRKDKGKYWPMITHIPYVEINYKLVFQEDSSSDSS